MESKYIFCNAPMRCQICRMDTNLCCLVCIHNADCFQEARRAHLKLYPCVLEDKNYDDGECEFKI